MGDEDARTRALFNTGQWTFKVALMAKREWSTSNIGRHWAVGLLHERGNIVVHIRNWELQDLDVSGPRVSRHSQLRIASWVPSHFDGYRSIVFQDTVTTDLDRLREEAWNLYGAGQRKPQNCQSFAIGLLQNLGVRMDGWMLHANCRDASGGIIRIPIREKQTVYTPIKLLTLGVLNVLSADHWNSCNVYFKNMLRDLKDTWTEPESSGSRPSGTSTCCI